MNDFIQPAIYKFKETLYKLVQEDFLRSEEGLSPEDDSKKLQEAIYWFLRAYNTGGHPSEFIPKAIKDLKKHFEMEKPTLNIPDIPQKHMKAYLDKFSKAIDLCRKKL